MTNTLRITYLALCALIIIGCGEDAAFQKHITEGVIEYDVSYPELDSNNLMLEMLPDKMIMTFQGSKYKSVLKTGGGIVEMSLISDSKSQTMYNMVKLFSDRYVLKLNHDQARKMTDLLPPFQIKELDDQEVIADASCKKVLLDFGTAKEESYIFSFTNEIEIEDPNWYTPYNDLKGVLLDYRIENYGMHMRLRAVKITPKEVDSTIFVIDDRYKELSQSEFDELITENMKVFLE